MDLTYNITKLIVAGLLAIALIGALVFGNDAADWAAPLLGLLIGYVIGNTRGVANISPIVETNGDN